MPQTSLAKQAEAPVERGPRAKLREAIQAFQTARARVEALEQGQMRAREQEREARTRLHGAKEALTSAKRNERQRLAYALLNGLDEPSPIPDAEARVDTARRELERAAELETALAEEL